MRLVIISLHHLDLAIDLSRNKNGEYAYIYEHRNALTHRYLVIHDMILSDQTQDDIPRIHLNEFLNEVIFAMQITRAAVMYLIMFVDSEENKKIKRIPYGSIYIPPVDGVFRWTPPSKE